MLYSDICLSIVLKIITENKIKNGIQASFGRCSFWFSNTGGNFIYMKVCPPDGGTPHKGDMQKKGNLSTKASPT